MKTQAPAMTSILFIMPELIAFMRQSPLLIRCSASIPCHLLPPPVLNLADSPGESTGIRCGMSQSEQAARL